MQRANAETQPTSFHPAIYIYSIYIRCDVRGPLPPPLLTYATAKSEAAPFLLFRRAARYPLFADCVRYSVRLCYASLLLYAHTPCHFQRRLTKLQILLQERARRSKRTREPRVMRCAQCECHKSCPLYVVSLSKCTSVANKNRFAYAQKEQIPRTLSRVERRHHHQKSRASKRTAAELRNTFAHTAVHLFSSRRLCLSQRTTCYNENW